MINVTLEILIRGANSLNIANATVLHYEKMGRDGGEGGGSSWVGPFRLIKGGIPELSDIYGDGSFLLNVDRFGVKWMGVYSVTEWF